MPLRQPGTLQLAPVLDVSGLRKVPQPHHQVDGAPEAVNNRKYDGKTKVYSGQETDPSFPNVGTD